MQTARTRIARIARLTAVSAVVVSLGALTAGPAAAQSGSDIGSRPASIDWVAVADPSSVTFSSEDDANSTTAVAAGWHYIDRYFWKSDCNRAGIAGRDARAWLNYQCRYGSAFSYYELWVYRA